MDKNKIPGVKVNFENETNIYRLLKIRTLAFRGRETFDLSSYFKILGIV